MSNDDSNKLALKECISKWSHELGEAHPVEQKEIVDAVKQLYLLLNKPAPVVIVCQSPWQLVMMKIILQRQVDENIRKYATKPSKDPFLPANARWLWRDLLDTYESQTTTEIRERFSLGAKGQGKDFWFSAFKAVVADLPFVGHWTKLAPSVGSEQQLLKRLLATFIESPLGLPWHDSFAQFKEEFPFAQEDRTFNGAVSRELVEYAIGNQPGDLKAQVIANLMSPVVSSVYRSLFARLELELSADEQAEHELKLLGMMAVNELVFTRTLVGTLPFLLFLREKTTSMHMSASDLRKLNLILRLCRATPALLTYEGICLVCSQPTEQKSDLALRLHCEDGPALSFSDGFQVYAWHGVRVARHIIESPDEIDARQILRERNLELRRVMMERLGPARFLKEISAKKIHEDKFGVLYRKELTAPEEPLVMVKVKNSTPEPDGSFKDYFIRVPPNVKTAKEAVAWTFGVTETVYAPDQES